MTNSEKDRGYEKGRDEPSSQRHAAPLLDPKMISLLVCPKSYDTLHFDEAAQELHSHKARLAYPVRDGVPILLISEARPLDDDELPPKR